MRTAAFNCGKENSIKLQCSYLLSSITLRKFPANSRAILAWDTPIPVLRNALFRDMELVIAIDLSSLQIETGR
jgi:hypothetical protein